MSLQNLQNPSNLKIKLLLKKTSLPVKLVSRIRLVFLIIGLLDVMILSKVVLAMAINGLLLTIREDTNILGQWTNRAS